jgi:hypothetical protein
LSRSLKSEGGLSPYRDSPLVPPFDWLIRFATLSS